MVTVTTSRETYLADQIVFCGGAWSDKLVRDLKAGGALVLDVPPSKLTPALINRYLEIKARQLL